MKTQILDINGKPIQIQFNQTRLLSRHWTLTTIKAILGEPDETRRFWTPGGMRTEKLWNAERVMKAEKGAAFRTARSALFTRRARRAQGKLILEAEALNWVKRTRFFSAKEDIDAAAAIYPRLKEFVEERPWDWIAGSLVFWPSYSPPDGKQIEVLRRLVEVGIVKIDGGLKKGWTKSRLLDVDLMIVPEIEEIGEIYAYDA